MCKQKIRIGICGYGNLGKGVEKAIARNSDTELVGIFTRRNPKEVAKQTTAKVVSIAEIEQWKDAIDVLIMCGGSATDLPKQVPMMAGTFNTVDSFDTHGEISNYITKVNEKAKEGQTISIVAVGWDPGMFSINRLYADSILPTGKTYTFWGKGVSQGHSDAIRRIKGVKNAVQYTIPNETAKNDVRNKLNPDLTSKDMHLRQCFVVAENGADMQRIEKEIKEMPAYFADYNTTVNFISEEELRINYSGMPHGGSVIHIAETGESNKHIVEYSLKLDSNPEFTGSILIAYARAAYRMWSNGDCGVKTVFDVPVAMLSPKSKEELLNMV